MKNNRINVNILLHIDHPKSVMHLRGGCKKEWLVTNSSQQVNHTNTSTCRYLFACWKMQPQVSQYWPTTKNGRLVTRFSFSLVHGTYSIYNISIATWVGRMAPPYSVELRLGVSLAQSFLFGERSIHSSPLFWLGVPHYILFRCLTELRQDDSRKQITNEIRRVLTGAPNLPYKTNTIRLLEVNTHITKQQEFNSICTTQSKDKLKFPNWWRLDTKLIRHLEYMNKQF